MVKEKHKQKKKDQKEMPFLDHLEELRWRILKCMGSIFGITFIAFFFTGWMLDILTTPLWEIEENKYDSGQC